MRRRTVEFESERGYRVIPMVGREVTVSYDPSRPEETKLHLNSTRPFPRTNFVAASVLGLGVILFLMIVDHGSLPIELSVR